MSSKKSPKDESLFDKMKEKISEVKNNIEEKMGNVKEKVDYKALVMLTLGCAAISGFLAGKVKKSNTVSQNMHKADQMNTHNQASPGLFQLDPGKAAPATAVLGGETVFTILHHFSLFKRDFQVWQSC